MTEHIMKACRRASVPLLAIETADPASTIRGCLDALNGKLEAIPLIEWDICRGLKAMNKAGERAIAWYDPLVHQLPDCLKLLAENPVKFTVLFLHNIHRFWERDGVAQGLWLLRDSWKAETATAVLLGPAMRLPGELVQDIVVTSEALPDVEAMGQIVDRVMESARTGAMEKGIKLPAEFGKDRAVDTLLGLSAFAAEQTVAMSVNKETGLDHGQLWERKRRLVEQTPGLSVWRGDETFDSLGGLSNLKGFLTAILTSGRTPVRCIGFIDEIEKAGLAAKGDLSGVGSDQLGVVLKTMQDDNVPGIILLGPAGTGKSAIAKACGGVAKSEVLSIDFGAMKGGIVGESEAKVRAAMDTFKAVAQGKGLFIATCNQIAALPPELRRRFTLGTFFVDLPSAEERVVIWDIWLKRYFGGMRPADMPDDEGWTGAEIKACCEVAFRTGFPLKQAAEFITPIIRSAPDVIKALREMASGKFISATSPGVYSLDESKRKAGGDGFRKLSVG
jgi:ATPase family associated with various cellular activities (AAA)